MTLLFCFFTVIINSNFSKTNFILGNYDEQNMWRNNTCFLFIWTQLKEIMKSKLCEIHHVICLPWPVNPTPSWGTQFSLRPPFSPIPYCGYHPFTATCRNDQDASTLLAMTTIANSNLVLWNPTFNWIIQHIFNIIINLHIFPFKTGVTWFDHLQSFPCYSLPEIFLLA